MSSPIEPPSKGAVLVRKSKGNGYPDVWRLPDGRFTRTWPQSGGPVGGIHYAGKMWRERRIVKGR